MIWPDGTKESDKDYCLARVVGADLAISLCGRKRTAVQAGGNVGLWPMRMAEHFERVITFEPEPISYDCLAQNIAHLANVQAYPEALGSERGLCSIKRRGAGSHRVIEGSSCTITPLDDLGLTDVDLIQLDVEGYEMEVLKGAQNTITLCRPIIQLELRGFTNKYGSTDEAVRAVLSAGGYKQVGTVPGRDYIFAPQ